MNLHLGAIVLAGDISSNPQRHIVHRRHIFDARNERKSLIAAAARKTHHPGALFYEANLRVVDAQYKIGVQ